MARTLSFLVVLCFGFGSTEVLYAQTPPLFDSSPVEEGTFNSGYLYEITSSDIEDNDRNIFLSSGSLPAGLILQDNGDGTASISGIPSETGDFPLELTVEETTGSPPQSGTQAFTLTINKALATINLDDLVQTFDGNPKSVSATTVPNGLGTLSFTYDGSPTAPTNAGDYTVEATLVNPNYEGSAIGILTVGKATATINLSDLVQTFDGNPKPVSATTVPSDLETLSITYDGSPTAPTNAGDYTVEATLVNPNYEGSAIGILTVSKATATINLSDLVQTFDGNPKPVSATTVPSDLETLSFTYNGSPTAPIDAGDYTVEATLTNANYAGMASGTLTINKAIASVSISNLNQNFDGDPKPVVVTTDPANLNVMVTYDGSALVPSAPGTYSVFALIDEINYEGSNNATLRVNGPPASIGIPNINVLEDAANTIINLHDFFDDVEDDDTDLVFSVESNTNVSLFTNVQLNDNLLTLDFGEDAFGLAELLIRVTDTGGLFIEESLQVNVESVNDAPSFTKGVDIDIDEDSGLQTVASWATNLSAGGGALESNDQNLFFTIDVSGDLQFSLEPEIDATNGNLSFRTALNSNGSASITVELFDTGPSGLPNVNSSGTQSFTITANPLNDPPVFARGINPTINEDAGFQTITNWATAIDAGGGNDESLQGLSFEVTLIGINPSDNLVFSQLPEINASTGTLTYGTSPNTNGTANFEVILRDTGSSIPPNSNESNPITLTITVNAVNDPPSFTKGADISINEDAGPQVINSWATNIQRGGGSDEIGQSLKFNVDEIRINSGNLTFSGMGPVISELGELSFTAAPDAFGVAEIDVFLSDDGSNIAPSDNASSTQTFLISVDAVQDDPVFTSSPVTGAVQDVLYEYDIVVNDPDLFDNLTIFSPVSLPSWLQLTDNGNGTARLFGTPTNSDIGTEGMVLRVTDNNGNDDTQFFDIVVGNSNDPPFFVSVPITTATEGINYIYNINANDDDIGDVLTISAPIKPDWLSLVDNGDGTAVLNGVPTNDDVGSNSVRLRVTDNASVSEDQDFSINVVNSNDPPSFISVPVTTADEDALYFYPVITTDPDAGDLLEIRVLSKPDWLNFTDNSDGTGLLLGTPLNQDVGTASIVLNVRDNNGANVNQNFSIIVSNTNDPPSFITSPVTAALQGLEYIYNISTTDPDIGDSRSIAASDLPDWLSLMDNGNGTAILSGTPSNSDFGGNPVVLNVTDINGAFVEQSFVINVDNANDAPLFTSSPIISGIEDDLYTYGITTNDPDAGDTRTISGLSIPDWLSLVDNGDGTANLSGTPTNDEVGAFSVVLNVRDALGANVNQNFTITITNTNDAPFFTSSPITAAFQDVSYTYSIQAEDVDEGDQVTILANTVPSWLNLVSTGSGTALLTGIPTNANLGTNPVSLRVTDNSGAFVNQSFVITVNNANDPPTFTSNPVTEATEDDLYTYEIITNDPDAGDFLVIRALVLPEWLELFDNNDGTAALTGIPENRDVGISNVVLNVEDALGDNTNQNFTIEISNTNDPPVFTSAPITGAIQDVLYSYAIVTSDPDLGDSRTITPVTVPLWLNLTDNGNGTANLFGTPTNSNLGSNAIQIRVTDAAGASLDQSFVINVDNINDTPSFTSDPVTNAVEDLPYIYNINTSDPDLGDTREITLLSGPDWINLEDFGDGSGQLTGTPLNGDVGSATIVINVEDALGANVNQNFTIAIDNTNDPPKFTSNPISIALQDVLYSYNVTADDEDLADEIIVKATTLPGWLNFNDNGSGSATLEGTPTNSDLGLNDVTLVVEDAAGAAVEQIFQINVDNSNDPPFFTSTAPTSVNEDNVYTYNIVTDDPDFGDVGTITSLSKPEWLTLIDSGDGTGTLLGTPENQDVGTVSVVLNVADGIGANVNQNFSITVLNTNDAPLFTSTPRTGAIQDIFYQYNIVAADDDQGDEMTLSVITAPNWTTFIDNGGGVGVLQGTPTNADLGSNTVTLRVTDLSGVSIDQTFVINVDNSNDPPSFTSTPLLNIDEDDLYSYNITTEDPDDGDTRIITALSKPSWLVISDNSDGTASLTGIPTNDDVGNHSVVLEVEDAVGSTAGQSFTIAVVNVNDPPNFESLPALGALQDQLYNYDILTSDPDVTDVLSIEATTLPDWLDFNDNGDGTAIISGTPRNEDLGDHDVVLRVTDRAGAAVEQLFTITADNTNDPPSFVSTPVLEVNEDANYQYLVEVTDPDAGDVITLDILAPSPDWLNFIDNGTGSGTLSGLPSNAEVGLHEVTLQATDVTGQRTLQSFEIEVINTNDPPAITSLPPTSVDEDSNYIYNLIVADDDIVFGDMVSFDFLGSLPMWLMFDPLTTTLSGTPLNDNVGSYDIVIRVSDNVGAFVDQNFTLVVNNTNDEPFFISVPVATVKEDERYEYQIEAADVDVGEQLSISAVSIPSWLLLEDVGDGTALLSGTPLNEDVGNIEIEIQVSDGVSDVAQTFNIEVVNVNDPPFFVSMPPTKVELGAQYQYTIVGEDVDQDDVLTISASDLPSYLSFTDLGNGKAVVEGEVTDLVFNDNLIRVEARDLTGEVASQEFLLEVNTLPVLTAAEINLVEDENYNFSTEFMMNFSDQDSDQLQKIVVNQIPVNGNLFKGSVLVTDNDTIEFIDQMPADLVYIPNSDFNGSDAFAWNGFDGTSWSLTNAVFSLTVESVNDLPQLTTNGALQPLSYRLGDPAINVVNSVDNLRIVDVDSRLMSRAEIRITDNASPGDRIFLNEQYQNDNIDVSYDVESATLLIVGEDLVNEYETILSNVLFSSPIDNEATVLTKQISLAVNDSLSSSNVLIRDIVIEEIFPELDIVNSFTPNGDGVNDTWDILNLQFYAKIRIEIFESGGARVFSCSSSDCQWDGFSNGKELPAGSYLYLIDLDDGRREYNGVVNILR